MNSDQWRWTWLGALGCFILAGSTGVLMRFGIAFGFPWGLQLANLRHAHSHLMIMGWITPALMGLIVAWLPRLTERAYSHRLERLFHINIGLVILFALLAYPPFFVAGYGSIEIGGRSLPLSTMASGLNMLAWYGFMILYWLATRGVRRTWPLRLWDAALAFFFLASLGAWGIAVLMVLGITSPVAMMAMTHIFLELLIDGWFVLGLLGLAYAERPDTRTNPHARRATSWIVMGLPVIFLLGMPTFMVPLPIHLLAGLGSVLIAAGLAVHIRILWPVVPPVWRVPLLFLGLKVITNLGLAVPAVAAWAERGNLRISYLHWLLLGFATLGLVAAARAVWGKQAARGWQGLTAVVLLLIVSLLAFTPFWPAVWRGGWTRISAAWIALGPVLVIVAMIPNMTFVKK